MTDNVYTIGPSNPNFDPSRLVWFEYQSEICSYCSGPLGPGVPLILFRDFIIKRRNRKGKLVNQKTVLAAYFCDKCMVSEWGFEPIDYDTGEDYE